MQLPDLQAIAAMAPAGSSLNKHFFVIGSSLPPSPLSVSVPYLVSTILNSVIS